MREKGGLHMEKMEHMDPQRCDRIWQRVSPELDPYPGGAGRLPGAIGIACAVVALLVCGPDNLVIPSMVLIFASLLIGRKKLCA